MGELEDTTRFETAWLWRAAIWLIEHPDYFQQWFETSGIVI